MNKADHIAFDRQTLRDFDVDGRMHVENCRISKACVNPYFGREIPDAEALGLDPEKIYYMYRHPDELAAAAPSFAHVPLLFGHVAVSADNPRQDVTVGTVGLDARFEAPYLVATLSVWVREAIDAIESKQAAQLSCSYRYRPDMTPGSVNGLLYDGVMRDIVANHVALVEEGRAGPDVVVSDQSIGIFTMSKSKHAARIAALKPFLAANADLVALDAVMEKEACDEAAEEEKKAKDKKAADEAAEEKKKADDEAEEKKKADDADMDDEGADDEFPPKDKDDKKADDAKISKADLDAAVKTAKTLARDEAVREINALHAARKACESVIGVVACDSAAEVYGLALDKLGVKYTGKDVAAMASLVEVATRKAPAASQVVTDAATVYQFPGVTRFKHA